MSLRLEYLGQLGSVVHWQKLKHAKIGDDSGVTEEDRRAFIKDATYVGACLADKEFPDKHMLFELADKREKESQEIIESLKRRRR